MYVICLLSFIVEVDNILFATTEQVKGKLLQEDNYNYLVNFTQNMKKFKNVQNFEEFKTYLIVKDKCIKIK